MTNTIGICGLIGSGKGTVGDFLIEEYGYQKISFADKLKDGVATIFGWDREMLEGVTTESREWREVKDEYWTSETGMDVTPRLVLQLFGTDCMRNGFHNNVWVSLVKKEILAQPDTKFVIPDVRFPNEIKMIQDIQGEVWQVRRGDLPEWYYDRRDNGTAVEGVHPSEWEWISPDADFDKIFENNSTLEDLYSKVKSAITA